MRQRAIGFLKESGPAIAIGVGLGVLGGVFLWQGHEQLAQGRIRSASTFRLPRREIATFHLMMLLAGTSFGAVAALTGQRAGERRTWRLVGGAMVPLLILLVTWDRYGPGWLPKWIHRRLMWFGIETEAAAAVLLGVMLIFLLAPHTRRGVTTGRSPPDR